MAINSGNHDAYYMRRLVDHVPSMLAYWDRDLKCRFANAAYKTWFGVEPKALIGASMEALLGPDRQEQAVHPGRPGWQASVF
jgi:PAS domain-containing protein